jgi:hypothetical protein
MRKSHWMTRSRRALLGSLAGCTIALAGCVSDPGSRSTPDADGTPSPDPTPDSTATAAPADEAAGEGETSERDPNTSEPVRGGAEPITVDRTVTDDDLEYLEDEHAVRYVAGWRHTNRTEIERGAPPEREPVYETTPFEDWARTECASVGADAVATRIEGSVEGDPRVGVGITRENEETAVIVNQTTTLNRDGEVVSEPSVPFERIVAATPRAVDATVRLAGQESSRTVPVWVEKQTVRYE